jgi:hypothetical protein
MKLLPVAPVLALFLPLLSGCGEAPIASSTTETENVLTAVELRVDSLLPDWGCSRCFPSVVTVRADSSVLDFSKTDSLGRDLVVERKDSVPVPFEIVFWDRAARLGRLHVRVDSSLVHPNTFLRLRWKAPLEDRSAPKKVWDSIPWYGRLSLNSVLVDDFEHKSLQSLLPDSASWYSAHSDSAIISTPVLVAADKGRKGTALHVSYNAPAKGFRYALVGIMLRKSPAVLRSLDSIEFWARGSGKFRVAFDHLNDSLTGGKAWAQHSIDSSWTRIALRPRDLDSANGIGGNVGWAAVRDSVTNLTFFVTGGSDLWIDDVRLYGIDNGDLR